jgi:hypothetical protein
MVFNKNISRWQPGSGKRLRLNALLLFLLTLLAGCASFKSTKRVDMTPFAESLVAVAGDILYSLEQEETIYIRDYLECAEVDSLDVMEDKVRAILRGTIAYAFEIVTLTHSKLPDSEKAELLAVYLDGAIRPVLLEPGPALNLTNAQLDSILDELRGQKDLLSAFGTAQPIVTEIARASGEVIEQTKDALDKAVKVVEGKIIMENKNLIAMKRKLRDEQIETMMSLSLLTDSRSGDATALDSLFAQEPSLMELIPSAGNLTAQDIKTIEDRMLYKLNTLGSLREQLIPDLELYWKKQRELGRLVATYNANLRKARVTMIVWAQAHERLAAGITDPAEYNIMGMAQAAGTGLARTALP